MPSQTRKKRRQRGGKSIFNFLSNNSASATKKYRPPHLEERSSCHPSVKPMKIDNTESCLTETNIAKLGADWNKAHSKKLIPLDDATKTWKSMREVLKDRCTTEYCWINQPFVSSAVRSELKKQFRPAAPASWETDSTEWLDSDNIYKMLMQLTEAYPYFTTIYPSPIDFDKKIYDSIYNGECVVNELCQLNVQRDLREKGKTAFGIVFNLDKHDEGGSHWVALYIDLAGNSTRLAGAYYWDSYGYQAPNRIKTLMKRIKNQEKLNGNNSFVLEENTVRHQRKNSECGIYSLYFIASMLEGRTFEDITKNIVDDDTINQMRHVYFTWGGAIAVRRD